MVMLAPELLPYNREVLASRLLVAHRGVMHEAPIVFALAGDPVSHGFGLGRRDALAPAVPRRVVDQAGGVSPQVSLAC